MSSKDLFYYLSDAREPIGPFSLEVLKQLRSTGAIGEKTRCAQAGTKTWHRYGELVAALENDTHPERIQQPEAKVGTHLTDTGKQDANPNLFSIKAKEYPSVGAITFFAIGAGFLLFVNILIGWLIMAFSWIFRRSVYRCPTCNHSVRKGREDCQACGQSLFFSRYGWMGGVILGAFALGMILYYATWDDRYPTADRTVPPDYQEGQPAQKEPQPSEAFEITPEYIIARIRQLPKVTIEAPGPPGDNGKKGVMLFQIAKVDGSVTAKRVPGEDRHYEVFVVFHCDIFRPWSSESGNIRDYATIGSLCKVREQDGKFTLVGAGGSIEHEETKAGEYSPIREWTENPMPKDQAAWYAGVVVSQMNGDQINQAAVQKGLEEYQSAVSHYTRQDLLFKDLRAKGLPVPGDK